MTRGPCTFTLATLLSACSLSPLPLAEDPVKCAIALARDEPLAQRNTGHSIDNLRSFADYFRRKAARDLSPQEQSVKAAEGAQLLSESPELQQATARACVEEAMRQLG
jgi:hypothetical protein